MIEITIAEGTFKTSKSWNWDWIGYPIGFFLGLILYSLAKGLGLL